MTATAGGLLSPAALTALCEVSASRRVGERFIVADDGRCDGRLDAFLRSRRFLSLAPSTQRRYSGSLIVWLDFLEAQGRMWDAVDADVVSGFTFWRLTDLHNPVRVGGSAANSDLAAIAALYEWAFLTHGVHNPVLRREASADVRTRAKNTRDGKGAPVATPAGVRDRNVKWLDPPAVDRWIDLAMRGFGADGLEPLKSRNRTGGRDAAYAQLLYGSGLRRAEGASLLLSELPSTLAEGRQFSTQRLAAACGKGHRGRSWWLPRAALGELISYSDGQRAQFVRNAQRRGAYRGPEWQEVEAFTANRRVALRGANGREMVSLDELDPEMRLRLLVRRDGALEPAMLWLNENGSPRTAASWSATFATGNERIQRLGLPWFTCTPHMLRHSFALKWYSIGRLLWDQRMAHLSADEQRDYRSQFGDTWTFVQTLLGHENPQTTVDTYLEPFKGLETQLLMECAADVPLSGLLEQLLTSDTRILRDPLAVVR